mmetsp:Transcript_3518/g.10917  ORF Transcript_3518/g.10917 Transcript_3518/m.10917 type:complete len:218 (-) Transcript_3518:1291-1944(-)
MRSDGAVRRHPRKEGLEGRHSLEPLEDGLRPLPALGGLPPVCSQDAGDLPVRSVGLVGVGIGAGHPDAAVLKVASELVADLRPALPELLAPGQGLGVVEGLVRREAFHKAWGVALAVLLALLCVHVAAPHPHEHCLHAAEAAAGARPEFGVHERAQRRQECLKHGLPALAGCTGLPGRLAEAALAVCEDRVTRRRLACSLLRSLVRLRAVRACREDH